MDPKDVTLFLLIEEGGGLGKKIKQFVFNFLEIARIGFSVNIKSSRISLWMQITNTTKS
ncbi:hypothetical protein LEP1GSC199_1280 [Leptospira vanthielii serovar Holland str. Waz Holland = ATCC 700522]|uniref:Uncharacterized protein n=1 Tax=Leptospira vanthielii serovar Holland str. Waz Holland = ATCC 700522 TaxID=1218591 RepID=N1WAJ3_9LEPT|nr:hypothetical protein LEP1GSC199_1280 [Leptospira vanthielii serovar Holland str. Waz Holland = ATCC 700522]